MVANRRLQDGENEYVTVTRSIPVYVNALHRDPNHWYLEGIFDGKVMSFRVLNEDRPKFIQAGYVPREIFAAKEIAVNITVLSTYDEIHRWRVAEVLPAVEVVHTEAERQTAWKLDVVKYGKFDFDGKVTATFARMGERVVWTRDDAGQYVRIEGNTKTVYEGKVS